MGTACHRCLATIAHRYDSALGEWASAGSGRYERGKDVVGASVEVLAGPVVAHRGPRSAWRAAICTSRRLTPASSMVVTKVWRSMCGCILGMRTPAARASWRGRRVAAWRSIRPPARLSRIGPATRSATARSMARPTAGGSGTRTTLPPLPHTRSHGPVHLVERRPRGAAGKWHGGEDRRGRAVLVLVTTTFMALGHPVLSTGWSTYQLQRTIQKLVYVGIPISLLLLGWLLPVGVIIYWIATNLVSHTQRRWTMRMMQRYSPTQSATRTD